MALTNAEVYMWMIQRVQAFRDAVEQYNKTSSMAVASFDQEQLGDAISKTIIKKHETVSTKTNFLCTQMLDPLLDDLKATYKILNDGPLG